MFPVWVLRTLGTKEPGGALDKIEYNSDKVTSVIVTPWVDSEFGILGIFVINITIFVYL